MAIAPLPGGLAEIAGVVPGGTVADDVVAVTLAVEVVEVLVAVDAGALSVRALLDLARQRTPPPIATIAASATRDATRERGAVGSGGASPLSRTAVSSGRVASVSTRSPARFSRPSRGGGRSDACEAIAAS